VALDESPAALGFADLLPPMLEALAGALRGGHELEAREVLEQLVDLGENSPLVVRPHVVPVAQVFARGMLSEGMSTEQLARSAKKRVKGLRIS
jgi:hypothetical protein